MRLACIAIGLFVAGFMVHWITWRIRIPRRQTATILAIMLATLPAGLLAMAILPVLQASAPCWPWEILHVAEFHIAMTLGYVVAYSALEQRSPSMTLLAYVADAGAAGRTGEQLAALLRAQRPVESRLENLLRDGWVDEAEGVYCLTGKGRRWARVFLQWQRLLRMEKGG